ncbi:MULTISPECIES: hypothetical protein [Streptomyces]|uniref:hypothetical protein n=1 Tax=Streptomyces TaxID=1883 RepID=UPI0015FEC03D|nr:hypothetical protein [Streptomyces murinus]MBA9050346.1 hypothetical protein [Streptomyces murinus]
MPLTHDAFQALPNWRTPYLRDLLMDSGVLPHLDRRLLLFERWLAQRIAATEDAERARIRRHFATWRQLRKLRAKAARSPLGTSTRQEARQQISRTGAFPAWLSARHVTLDSCTQTDLRCLARGKVRHPAARADIPMLVHEHPPTAVAHHPEPPDHQPRPDGPTPAHRSPATGSRRRKHLTESPSRFAVCLVPLFAHPVSRIVRMTTDDVVQDGQHVTLRLGAPPTPVPEPVADLLLDHLQALPASTPAINQNSHRLFPGRRPSQPVNTGTLRDALREPGVPAEKAAPRPSAGSSSRPKRPSSPKHWATTTRAPLASPPKPARPGRTTHPADNTR